MTLRALAFALAYLVLPAAAHDFWLDRSRVDPRTKLYCCGENDCHLLPVSQAHPTKGGYLLDDTSETIAWDRVQPSPTAASGLAAGAARPSASSRRFLVREAAHRSPDVIARSVSDEAMQGQMPYSSSICPWIASLRSQ